MGCAGVGAKRGSQRAQGRGGVRSRRGPGSTAPRREVGARARGPGPVPAGRGRGALRGPGAGPVSGAGSAAGRPLPPDARLETNGGGAEAAVGAAPPEAVLGGRVRPGAAGRGKGARGAGGRPVCASRNPARSAPSGLSPSPAPPSPLPPPQPSSPTPAPSLAGRTLTRSPRSSPHPPRRGPPAPTRPPRPPPHGPPAERPPPRSLCSLSGRAGPLPEDGGECARPWAELLRAARADLNPDGELPPLPAFPDPVRRGDPRGGRVCVCPWPRRRPGTNDAARRPHLAGIWTRSRACRVPRGVQRGTPHLFLDALPTGPERRRGLRPLLQAAPWGRGAPGVPRPVPAAMSGA